MFLVLFLLVFFDKLNKKIHKRKEDRYTEAATAGFIYAVNWIMLHEIAHIKLKHKNSIGEDKLTSINIENKTDEYATKNILPSTVFAIGIAIALLSIQSDEIRREIQNTDIRNRTHPQTFERIYRCLCEHAEIEDDAAAYRCSIRIIQMQLCWHYYQGNLLHYEKVIASVHEKDSFKNILSEYILLLRKEYQQNK